MLTIRVSCPYNIGAFLLTVGSCLRMLALETTCGGVERHTFFYWNGVLGRGCDEAETGKKSAFSLGPRHSVNEGVGKEFYGKANSLKRFRPLSETPDSKNWNLLHSSPSQISAPLLYVRKKKKEGSLSRVFMWPATRSWRTSWWCMERSQGISVQRGLLPARASLSVSLSQGITNTDCWCSSEVSESLITKLRHPPQRPQKSTTILAEMITKEFPEMLIFNSSEASLLFVGHKIRPPNTKTYKQLNLGVWRF